MHVRKMKWKKKTKIDKGFVASLTRDDRDSGGTITMKTILCRQYVFFKCVFPTALCCSESWTQNKEDMIRIQAFEMKCYRKLLNMSDNNNNNNNNNNNQILKRLDIKNCQLVNRISVTSRKTIP